MKIISIKATPVSVPTIQPCAWSLGTTLGTTRTILEVETEDGITGLKDRFGKEMIDKHASNITALCTKYPEQSVYSVFKHLCSDEDFTTALLSERDKKSKSELKRKKDGSEPGGPTSVNKIEAVRGKGGRIDWRSHLQKLKDAGRFS